MVTDNTQNDTLTGLLSRKAFEERFEAVMQQATKSDGRVSLGFLDIDSFLEVNEKQGHSAGDAILQEVAALLKEYCGEEAILARYGGDEFAVLFPDCEREQAFLTLERVRAAVDGKSTYGMGESAFDWLLTVSAGVASFPFDASNASELFRKADQAVYRAKVTGRNSVRLAYEERMLPKTTHFTLTQLERLSDLAKERSCTEAELLREALDDLLVKHKVSQIFA